jgi:uncharacterized protein (TIRG00374 family)
MMKKILIALAVVLVPVVCFLSFDIFSSVFRYLNGKPTLILVLVIAIIIQLVGHLFRAKRTKILIDQAAKSSDKFQFLALSAGYLYNAILPFRLGELVRALLIARRLQISLLYTFAAVVIERLTDIIFLGVVVIMSALLVGGNIATSLIIFTSIILLVTIFAMMIIYLLNRENKVILNIVSSISSLFNVNISNSVKFKVWSLIFGLQSFTSNKKLIKRYVHLAVLSWCCYLLSSLTIVVFMLGLNNISQIVVAGVSPYIISIPVTTPLGIDSYHQLATLLPVSISASSLIIYAKIIWVVLTVPMAILGVVSIFIYKSGSENSSKSRAESFRNKLTRHADISQAFPIFLETYFKNSDLSQILHKIEVGGDLSLVKFFKGGSDAITVLALKDEKMFVKKIVPYEFTERLRIQYNWLKKYNNKVGIVNVIGEQENDDYYAIDLSYDPGGIMLFEYVHTRSLEQSKDMLDRVWKYVYENIYKLRKEATHKKERDNYVEERLMQKVIKACEVDDDLRSIIDDEKIKINGKVYDNFYTIINKIKADKTAWSDIATYRESDAIHGDLTVDNILVNVINNKPLIIDPSDDNQVRGPILDFARHTQSLAAGYEFLNDDISPTGYAREVDGLVSINYINHRSARYMQLYEYFRSNIIKKYLTKTEAKTVLFHTGLLYGRILAHRVHINPDNVLKYYAVCVVLLNEFYEQYK